MSFRITARPGLIALAIYLIVVGANHFGMILIPGALLGVVAIVAGVLILLEK
jgi:hypothetical protein